MTLSSSPGESKVQTEDERIAEAVRAIDYAILVLERQELTYAANDLRRAKRVLLLALIDEARKDSARLDFIEREGGFSYEWSSPEKPVGMSMCRWGDWWRALTLREAVDGAMVASSSVPSTGGEL